MDDNRKTFGRARRANYIKHTRESLAIEISNHIKSQNVNRSSQSLVNTLEVIYEDAERFMRGYEDLTLDPDTEVETWRHQFRDAPGDSYNIFGIEVGVHPTDLDQCFFDMGSYEHLLGGKL